MANLRQLNRLEISGCLQYALQKTNFHGPITGGFAADEPLLPGDRIIPAFDQTHPSTVQIFCRSRWAGFLERGARHATAAGRLLNTATACLSI
jgi:hypothetical protein